MAIRRVMRIVTMLALASMLLGSCSPAARSTPVPTPTARVFEPTECVGEVYGGRKMECGYLTVPEDRSKPDGRMLRLHVAIVPSTSENPLPDPVFYLEGGPGNRAHLVAGLLSFIMRDILKERDIIIMDHRGTGLSEPALDCPEPDEADLAANAAGKTKDEIIAARKQGWQICRDRLTGEGIDLSLYNSANNAADVADLAQTLGIEQYNLLGIFYGTRLALTILRDYPQGVRSAILDSVLSPNVDFFETANTNAERSLDLLFERCAADARCSAKFPNLEADFYSLAEKLNQEPIMATVNGREYPVHGDDFIAITLNALYASDVIKDLPSKIAHADTWETQWLSDWLGYFYGAEMDLGVYLSTWCSEEVPFNSQKEKEQQDATVNPAIVSALDSGVDIFEACEMWGIDPAGKRESEPVASDIPVLLLSGDYDPATPPELARLAAETLTNSKLYEFMGLSHGVLFFSDCAVQMATQFVANPAEEIDASCMEELKVEFNVY